MIHNIAEKLGSSLAKKTNKTKDEKEILIYSLERLLINTTLITVIAIISNALNILSLSLIVILTFLPIRFRFGGGHFNKEWLCWLVSVTIAIGGAYLTNYINFTFSFLIIIYVCSYIIALKIGVVDNENKRLEEEIKKKFKKEGLIVLAIIFIINIIAYQSHLQEINDAILIAVIVGFGNLFFGLKK